MSEKEFVETGLLAAIKTASNLEKRVAELERENAALRADKERLDWLERNGPWDQWVTLYDNEEDVMHVPLTLKKPIRAAIDAARKEAQP